MSTKNKIVKYLRTGKTLTSKQGEVKFGVTNFTGRIAELRTEGYPNIYTNSKKVNGAKVNTYRLGTPTHSMLQANRLGKLDLASDANVPGYFAR